MTVKILAIDTATENCSVALKIGDEVIHRCEFVPRDHTLRILPLVDSVLSESGLSLNDLDVLAYGRGPGSFTGVRIGIGVAQGLAFGADLPTIGVSTLAAMAEQAYRKTGTTKVLSAIDARMSEVYFGGFQRQDNGDWRTVLAEVVIAPDKVDLADCEGDWAYVGTGWQTYPDLAQTLQQAHEKVKISDAGVLYPEAQDMLLLAIYAMARGETQDASEASPVYLRNTVAWKKLPGRE